MRTLKKYILILAGFCLLMTCTESDDLLIKNYYNNGLQVDRSNNQTLTIPFIASFVTYGIESDSKDDEACGLPPVHKFSIKGYGKATELGNITIPKISFCYNIESGEYWNAVGSFVIDGGGELFLTTGGQIIPANENDPPFYREKWNDPFNFTGGTGRFEGATGGGVTQNYNSNIPGDSLNHHFWIGTLTLLWVKQ